MKTQSRPWITKGILISIRKKVEIHSKSLKAKYRTRKEALNQEYKICKNLLINITKKSKENVHKQYFKDNKNNLINVWKRNKEKILIKIANKPHLNCLKIGEQYSTDSKKMAKHFNKYFGTITKNIVKRNTKIKKEIFRLFKKSKLNFISPKPCNRKRNKQYYCFSYC